MFDYLGEELPYYTKFLLIASFLAYSDNLAKSDKFFIAIFFDIAQSYPCV